MDDKLAPRSFREKYTFRNIRNELVQRLAGLGRRAPPAVQAARAAPDYDDSHAKSVGRFYDRHHDKFMAVYGDVIQAFRTTDVRDLLNHQIESIGLQAGQRVLDAGCGVGAPAIHFAKHADVCVDAITISQTQYSAACRNVAAANLQERIKVVHGDYHRLPDHFREGTYDAIYFLESFSHSTNKRHLVGVCWRMLKPGGIFYVKDLFARPPLQPGQRGPIEHEIQKINQAYHYNVGDLNAVLDDVRGRGFILNSLNSVDLDLAAFEGLAISNDFQELTGIALIRDWDTYVFPVDFFELRCIKPDFDLSERPDRHFMQNQAALRGS